MSSKFKLFFPCYFSFFVNGAMVLMVGAILPYIIDETGISYSIAGGFLSAFAIGNLLASFINPVLAAKIGRKAAIVSMCALIPLMFLVITLMPPIPVLYGAFVLMGVGRGSVSIINNAVVNDNSDGNPAALNLLHMVFSVGAFIAPFLIAVYINNGLGWRAAAYTIIAGSALSCVFYALMEIDYNWPKGSKRFRKAQKSSSSGLTSNADNSLNKNTKNGPAPFYKTYVFYIMGLLLFLYLGLENCVNGWFVTYFKSMGIMSETYAANLVSVTWIMVMLGRFVTAKLSGRINKNVLILVNCIATAVFFFLLTATQNLAVITAAIAGLGFFFAGIYPTAVSGAGNVIKGSNTGMSMLLAIAALGGIITPQIVGVAADGTGLTGAILILSINVAGMFVMALLNMKFNSGKNT